MGSMVERAFDAGWGGAVWKTLGEPIVNVSSRLASLDQGALRMIGLNNIELITDRPLDVNLKEIYECKKKYPDHAVIVSLMVESKREAWHEIVKKSQDTGADGFELNFGCPHGMSERGMGAAMGQVPEYTCMVTEWVKEVSNLPVIVKLTPNVTHIIPPGRAAQKGGADAVSLINTINSVMGVDIDTMIRTSTEWRPTAATVEPPSNLSLSTWFPSSPAMRNLTFRSAALEELTHGVTRLNSYCLVPEMSRSALL
jgi:dihydropyrimidine dehydrogenase (NAD+) subunit PreA